jgi:hypothetical protein
MKHDRLNARLNPTMLASMMRHPPSGSVISAFGITRAVGWFLALEDPAGVNAGKSVLIQKTAPVAHQPAGRGELTSRGNSRHRVAERQGGKHFAPLWSAEPGGNLGPSRLDAYRI